MRIMRHSNDDLIALAIIQYRIPSLRRFELPLSATWYTRGAISVVCSDAVACVESESTKNANDCRHGIVEFSGGTRHRNLASKQWGLSMAGGKVYMIDLASHEHQVDIGDYLSVGILALSAAVVSNL
jgi:hypothetical protein